MITSNRTISTRHTVLASVLVLELLSTIGLAFSQSASASSKTLSRDKIAELLREPDGLAAAANLAGKFVIDGQVRVWSITKLSTLVSSSSLILEAKIAARESRLVSNGDDIDTDYTVTPENIVKGKVSGGLSFTAHGGLIEFPNGTSAEITTVEWRQLQVGGKYVLFLRQEEDGRYYPANGIEALFRLSTADGNVDALAAHDERHHIVNDEVKALSISAFRTRVQTLVAENATK